MVVNTNNASLNALEASKVLSGNLQSSLEKLSSGSRINKASDDASGLSIADKLRTQKNSLAQSLSNGNSAVAMIQIADKAMSEQSNILDIVKTKLIQAASDTTSDDGKKAIAKDINKLLTQLDNIAAQTNYNGVTLLQQGNGTTGNATNQAFDLKFQMGESEKDLISVSGTIQANTYGLGTGDPSGYDLSHVKDKTSGDGSRFIDTSSTDYPTTFMSVIDKAITDLNSMRAEYGSTQNQIESSMRNMMTATTNIAAAESVIRDVDYASESANFNKQNIMSNANSYAQSQANMRPNDVLSFLN